MTGTGPAFASVAVLATVLGIAAWRTPAFTPEHPQPLAGSSVRSETGQSSLRSGSCWCPRSSSALNVLGPLRLDVLGLSALAIGATWLVAASFEAALSPVIGRFSTARDASPASRRPDRLGRRGRRPALDRPGLAARRGDRPRGVRVRELLDAVHVDARRPCRAIGLDYAYGFALINLAWAPGAAAGSRSAGGSARDVGRRRLPDALGALHRHAARARAAAAGARPRPASASGRTCSGPPSGRSAGRRTGRSRATRASGTTRGSVYERPANFPCRGTTSRGFFSQAVSIFRRGTRPARCSTSPSRSRATRGRWAT